MCPNTFLNYLLDYEFKSIWTTNYDKIIEDVLSVKNQSCIPMYKYEDFQKISFPGGLFLYKINGSIDCPKSIVITKEDFISYPKTHEAYLILLKRELLCNSFLFLGCSFDDDILRTCIKDILNCIENSNENYSTVHYAIAVDSDTNKLDFISKDLSKNYKMKCLKVQDINNAYKIAQIISYKVKYFSIFISGAIKVDRHSEKEIEVENVCKQIVDVFLERSDNSEGVFKFVSGMGMSIGNFISGRIRAEMKGKNVNRFLQMEPFPFTTSKDNDIHRKNIIKKAGIFRTC